MFFSKSSNSRVEFGEFSKLKCEFSKLSFKRKKSEFGEFFKLRFKISKLRGSEVLKISNVQVQTHFLLKTMDTKKKTQILRLSPVWVQKVVRVSREQNFATRKQLYSWESSREGEFSNLCCQNLQAYMWPARLYCCCFCK